MRIAQAMSNKLITRQSETVWGSEREGEGEGGERNSHTAGSLSQQQHAYDMVYDDDDDEAWLRVSIIHTKYLYM